MKSIRQSAAALVVLALGCLASLSATAGCATHQSWSPDTDPHWLHTYDGTIDKYRIRLTIAFSGDRFSGRYFYHSTLKDIRIEGRFTDGRQMVIDEYGEGGNVVAQFKGEFPVEDPQEHYGPGNKVGCEVMVGLWRKLDTEKDSPFYLNNAFSMAASIDDRYARTGIGKSDLEIEDFAQRFIKNVREDNRRGVVEMIHYPFRLHLDGVGLVRIRNRADLLKNYDALFTDAYKKSLFAEVPKHMAVIQGMIRIGFGWIGEDMKVWPLGRT